MTLLLNDFIELISKILKSQKRIRTFPLFHNSYIEQQAMDNANQPEELVPIRIDMELEGLVLSMIFC